MEKNFTKLEVGAYDAQDAVDEAGDNATEEMKQAANKAWNDLNEFQTQFEDKRWELDNQKAVVQALEDAISAREGLDGLAQEAENKRTALENFRNGDLKTLQDDLAAAEAAMEGKAEGTEEFKTANKALEEARKKANRGESEAAQFEEDLVRQENQLYRESEREGIRTELDEARGQKAYFDDVITYYNAKLQFFDAIEQALNLEDEEDYNFFMQIQPEKEHLWDMLDSLHS